MEVIQGTATFPGIAIGCVRYYHRNLRRPGQNLAQDIQAELELFEKVRESCREQLEQQAKRAKEEAKGEAQELIELLLSPSFIKAVESMISLEKVTVGYALETTKEELITTFGGLETPSVCRRIENIQKLTSRLLTIVESMAKKKVIHCPPAVLAAEVLSPTDVVELEKDKLLAVVTHIGSNVAHGAIMAKNLNIPALVDVEVTDAWDGKEVIVDGYTGTLYVEPDSEMKKEYEIRRQAETEEREELLKLKNARDITLDGKVVGVMANVGSLDDLNSVRYYGASGIGLLRSEFQYLGRETYPREQELYRAYKKVAEFMGDRISVIRTVDLGADKQSEYMDIPEEANPIMGNRGIRLCLDRRHMFRAQLRAIYRASAHGNLAIMYPMISSLEEIREVKALVQEVTKGLKEKQIPFNEQIPVGIMIETPAAVMISGELAKEVNFLSLGTNDLTQYTLAMDRQNPGLKGKYNDHHPAVLRMIDMVVKEGHKSGCKVTICGELAADTTLTEHFVKIGVDALSVVPACILPVRKVVRQTKAYQE